VNNLTCDIVAVGIYLMEPISVLLSFWGSVLVSCIVFKDFDNCLNISCWCNHGYYQCGESEYAAVL